MDLYFKSPLLFAFRVEKNRIIHILFRRSDIVRYVLYTILQQVQGHVSKSLLLIHSIFIYSTTNLLIISINISTLCILVIQLQNFKYAILIHNSFACHCILLACALHANTRNQCKRLAYKY